MPVLDERHDFAHPVEGDSAWSESYYFNCYDPVTDTGFFTRIGVRPNEGTMDVGMSVWLPGAELAQARAVREQHQMTDSDLRVGDVTYERLEPGRRWRLTTDSADTFVRALDASRSIRTAPVRLDVTFDALTPMIGADGQGREGSGASAQTRGTVGKGHLEQAGRWSGWIEADGVRHELVEARGNRDKSWGPRRWGGPRMWRWFSVNFGDDVHFGGIRIGTDSGDLHRGWVWKDGAASSVREWRVKTELADDGTTHTRSLVTAVDKRGVEHALDGTLLRVAPHLTEGEERSTLVNEGLARFEHEGVVGYGIAEYLHQLDAGGAPLVPIE
jgi:hypothetical protein